MFRTEVEKNTSAMQGKSTEEVFLVIHANGMTPYIKMVLQDIFFTYQINLLPAQVLESHFSSSIQ